MTQEELKKHCLKQVEACEMWARHNGEEPHGKVYEEHKLILELLEQQPFINKPCISEGVCREDKMQVLDKIRAEIVELRSRQNVGVLECLDIIDKYRTESEEMYE